MADPLLVVADLLRPAFAAVAGEGADPVVRPSDRADAQANGALSVAKQMGRAPRDVAADVVAAAELGDVASLEVAGPGFINVTFANEFLAQQLAAAMADERLGVRAAQPDERVVVDYAAPNVAKEMHAGHLRSTVIGDSLCRLLSFVGHTVIRENHVGDWGTPFGMNIEHLLDVAGADGIADLEVKDLDAFYKQARVKFDSDPGFKRRAQERVVLLQSRSDPETMRLWQAMIEQSLVHFHDVYGKLGVLLTDDDLAGESRYMPMMPGVLDRLAARGLLDDSDGAKVVWVDGYTNRDGDPLPLIVQARTGGFNYATSDLACVLDRVERLGATLLLYVVGTPQSQHLAMVFAVAEKAGWLAPPVRAVHVNYGSVLGDDRKMLKSRSGDPVKFIELIDEAIERGRIAVAERDPDLPAAEQQQLGHTIGIGALKYAELSSDRIKDYVFDWNRMLAFDGNTAPYLQYAHARICSIFRKADIDRVSIRRVTPTLIEPAERELALRVLQFDGAVHETLDTFSPHKLCTYIYDLARTFTSFYDACPVLRDDVPADVRESRLSLCDAAGRTLAEGLGLLGISAPERM
jgi:arginyl-tRNA synthetase